MESAKHDLGLMIRLQQIYTQIAEAIQERGTDPPEVKEMQEDNLRRSNELEQLEAKVVEHEEELVQVRKKEGEWKVELEHFQKQKAMVTNEREFTAVISEIDYATKALGESSGRRKELEEEIDKINQEIESRRQARPEEEATQKKVVAGWEKRKTNLMKTIHGLATQANGIEGQLRPKNRARFLRLLKSKHGTAIAAVMEGSCSVCHFSLRPHLQQRVRRGEELIACEHCNRILYFEEMQEQQTEAADQDKKKK